MTVQTYLNHLASELNLKTKEKEEIDKSLLVLKQRLNKYFENQVMNHFEFGSYTRGTMLRRKADMYSDVDYMIIFDNSNQYKPQTLLTNLKKFVNLYYHSSEIRQSHPTIILELNHIKFELVPAKIDFFGTKYIPAKNTGYEEWIPTDPNDFNSKLTTANVQSKSNLKPLIRIMKYWNRLNGNHLSSYELERWIVSNNYTVFNLRDFVYQTFERLQYRYDDPISYKTKLDRAKRIIQNARKYEYDNLISLAEQEIEKLLPNL